MNKVILIGRLTRDPESATGNEKTYTKFSVAVDRIGEGADFINCVSFGKTAEFIAKYFNKGKMIAIEGHLNVNSYKDKDGNNRTATNVVVDRVEFCGKEETKKEEGFTMLDDSDIPF